MKPFIHIASLALPSYGLMIVTGVLAANLVALLLLRKRGIAIMDLIILEAYGLGGAFLGSKLLYLFIARKQIAWKRMIDPAYFDNVMKGGYVFYGGLILAVCFILLAGRIHKIDAFAYLKECAPLIPMAHGFGRIGCFLAGCCYGIPYVGTGAVVFPKESFAPSGISLFPVQLVEAAGLFGISVLLFVLLLCLDFPYTMQLYLFLYGILRFVLEHFRGDSERGAFAGISTSRWIAMGMILLSLLWTVFAIRATNRKKSDKIVDVR